MAIFILCRNDSSSCTRFCMLGLISLVLVCSFSYGSPLPKSSLDSSSVDNGNDIENFDNNKNYDGKNNHHRLSFRPASYINPHIDPVDHPMLSRKLLRNLLLQLALSEEQDRLHRQNEVHVESRRYAPQSFHAMRG